MEEYIYDNEGGLKRIQYSGNRYLQTVMFSIAIYSIAIFLCFKVLLETLQTGENRGAIFVIIGALTVLSVFFFAMINSYVVISFEDDKVVFKKLFRKMIIPYFELKVISHIPYKHAGNVSSYNHYRSTIYFSSKSNVDSKKIAIRLSGKFLSGKSGTIKDYSYNIMCKV